MRSPQSKRYFAVQISIIVLLVPIFIVGYCGYVSYSAKSNIDMRIDGDWPIMADEVLGFAHAKNASYLRHHLVSGLTYHMFNDHRGARVSASGQRTPDHVEILTIGGSFSWGHGMENEKTFTEILGRNFNVPVANLSLGSYGTVQSLQLLERNSDLEPKVVIYGFISDHIRRNLSPCAPSYAPYCLPVSYVDFDQNGEPNIMAPVVNYSAPTGKAYYQYVAEDGFGLDDIRWGAQAITSYLKTILVWGYSNDTLSRQTSMKYLMKKMADAARKIKAKLVVVYIPFLERDDTDPAPSELIDALDHDTVFIDTSSAVQQYYANPNSPLLRFESDLHPNELGHQLIAREIYRVLKAMDVF